MISKMLEMVNIIVLLKCFICSRSLLRKFKKLNKLKIETLERGYTGFSFILSLDDNLLLVAHTFYSSSLLLNIGCWDIGTCGGRFYTAKMNYYWLQSWVAHTFYSFRLLFNICCWLLQEESLLKSLNGLDDLLLVAELGCSDGVVVWLLRTLLARLPVVVTAVWTHAARLAICSSILFIRNLGNTKGQEVKLCINFQSRFLLKFFFNFKR